MIVLAEIAANPVSKLPRFDAEALPTEYGTAIPNTKINTAAINGNVCGNVLFLPLLCDGKFHVCLVLKALDQVLEEEVIGGIAV